MELNISAFFNAANPFDYSASRVERGDNAGQITWNAANNADFDLLDNTEKREAFRLFVRDSGGWTTEEIAAWSDTELNALCIQWVSGDMREPCGFEMGPDMTAEQWSDYEAQCEAGQCAARIFKGTDGNIYFYIGI